MAPEDTSQDPTKAKLSSHHRMAINTLTTPTELSNTSQARTSTNPSAYRPTDINSSKTLMEPSLTSQDRTLIKKSSSTQQQISNTLSIQMVPENTSSIRQPPKFPNHPLNKSSITSFKEMPKLLPADQTLTFSTPILQERTLQCLSLQPMMD